MAFKDPAQARAYYTSYRQRNRDKIRASSRKYSESNRTYYRERGLMARYGLTLDDRQDMFDNQKGLCVLCGLPLGELGGRSGDGTVVDHNHETGRVRALLHRACNVRLASVEDSAFLQQALAYLEKYNVT